MTKFSLPATCACGACTSKFLGLTLSGRNARRVMEKYRSKPFITEDISRQRIIYVNDLASLEYATAVLFRYFVLGLDAKIRRGDHGQKYITHLILATSNEVILIDVQSIPSMWAVWENLRRLLSDVAIIKIGYEMSSKMRLIRDTLGGAYIGGLVDLKEAFRALELTQPSICSPKDEPCDGLRVLGKICYNLLDRQYPQVSTEMYNIEPVTEEARQLIASNAFVNFHAYVELSRRVGTRELLPLIQELLTEPSHSDFLTLNPSLPVYFVDTIEAYIEAASDLQKCSVIGFDCEWKPTRAAGVQGRMAILQMASPEKVFIFDIIRLKEDITFGDWALLKTVFEDPNITKLGFDLRDDSKLLNDLMGEVQIQSSKDLAVIMRALEKRNPDVMRSSHVVFPVVRGLSRLCNILLGRPLNKAKCLSMTDWECRPLETRFLEYAALDAHCLVLCWRELLRRVGLNAEERLEGIVQAYNEETEALRNAL